MRALPAVDPKLEGSVSPGLAPEARASNGAHPWLGALALLLSIAAIAWFFTLLLRDVEAAQFATFDPASSRMDSGPGWVDPRWENWTAQALARLPEMEVDAPDARAHVARTLEALPFVSAVASVRVLWPDGLQADVRLREPVACVRCGRHFLTVAGDGVILPGLWSLPPQRAHGFLPLVALDPASREELADGGRLTQPAAVDGLAVASGLARELAPDDWVRLGRIVVDARRARVASVDEPGTVLWLEGGRRVYFGRSPNLGEPGELPFESKCAALSRALRLGDAGPEAVDWELIDARWDRPEVLPRGGIDDPSSHRGAIR